MKIDREKTVDCKDEKNCFYQEIPLDIVENCLKCERNKKCKNPEEDYFERIKKVGY